MATLTDDGLSAMFQAMGLEGTCRILPSADMKYNPLEIYTSHLAEILGELTDCDAKVALDSIQWPVEDWDLAVVLPRLRLEDGDSVNPAADLQQRFPSSSLFASPVPDGIQLRLLFAPITLARILLSYILDRGTSYGNVPVDENAGTGSPNATLNKLLVDFSSPNLGKEFDGNYLRSTIIGTYVASLHQALGWDVVRMNFLGDWGRHIGLLAVGWLRFGSEELFQENPLKHLVEVFSQINELSRTGEDEERSMISTEKEAFFRRMEDGDQDAVELCRRFRDACVQQYKDQYARLNITFDEYSGESMVSPEIIAQIETALRDHNAYRESDGAWIIDFESFGYKGLKTSIGRYSDGTTTYLLRDIAAAVERHNLLSFDKMVYVVTSKQDLHFREVNAALEIIGHAEVMAKLQHINFGKFQGLPRNEDSRGLQLKDIVDQCQGTVDEFLAANPEDFEELRGDTTHDISGDLTAIGLMAQELSIRRGATFNFDLHKMGDLDGHSGLSLHYWFTQVDSRLQGVIIDRAELENADYAIFEEEAYYDVLRVLIQFPAMVKSSIKNLESSVILNYLYRLTDILSTIFQNEEQEVGESSNLNIAKLAFFECVRQTLCNGMAMLGLVPVRIGQTGSIQPIEQPDSDGQDGLITEKEAADIHEASVELLGYTGTDDQPEHPQAAAVIETAEAPDTETTEESEHIDQNEQSEAALPAQESEHTNGNDLSEEVNDVEQAEINGEARAEEAGENEHYEITPKLIQT